MNYFYEFDNSLHNRPGIYYPDSNEVISPLIKNHSQISILEWEIIDELCKKFSVVYHDNAWGLYFKYPTALPRNKYIFFVLLVLTERSDDFNEKKSKTLRQVNFILKQKYAFIDRVIVKFITQEDLELSRNFQFLVKVIYYRVAGVDFESKFSEFRVGNDLIHFLPHIASRIEEFKKAAENPKGVLNMERITYLVKLLIRSAFELVIGKEKFFTRDPYQCCESFNKYYPSYANLSKSLLSCLGTSNFRLDDFLILVNDFGNVLTTEYKKIITLNPVGNGKN